MDWVWGVDVSTRRVAVGKFSSKKTVRWESRDIPQDARGAQRLARIRRATVDLCQQPVGLQPRLVLVEDANVGAAANKPLLQAVAVVFEAVFATLRCEVREVPVGTWKKATIGRGNAQKPEVMAFARGLGYTGDLQDEADALVIASMALGEAMLPGAGFAADA